MALFDLISERASVNTIQQLLRISPKALNRLEDELFAYFAEDRRSMTREELESMFDIFEVKHTSVGELLGSQTGVTMPDFKDVLAETSHREYLAYSRRQARTIFLTGVVFHRLSYYQKNFASQGFALYLLTAVRVEVDIIRERRIRAELEREGAVAKEEGGAEEEEEARVKRVKRCSGWRRCVHGMGTCMRWVTVRLVICCCFTGVSTRHREMERGEFSEEIGEEELERLRPSRRKKARGIEHRPSPEWEVIADHIVRETRAAIEDYDPKRGLPWRCSSPNVVMLAIKLLEFFSLMSFLWSSDIPWNFSDAAASSLTIVHGGTSAADSWYPFLFGVALALAVLYLFIVRPAAIRARNGTLGMNKDGRPAKLCTRAFLFSKLVQTLSASLYTFILKVLLDSFSCDFSASPGVLLRWSELECFGTPHFLLMAGGLVGILAYYPFATFLYANLQFINKDTDLKYHPQFVVYLA